MVTYLTMSLELKVGRMNTSDVTKSDLNQ